MRIYDWHGYSNCAAQFRDWAGRLPNLRIRKTRRAIPKLRKFLNWMEHICSVQFGNLRNLEIALPSLGILKLRSQSRDCARRMHNLGIHATLLPEPESSVYGTPWHGYSYTAWLLYQKNHQLHDTQCVASLVTPPLPKLSCSLIPSTDMMQSL
jgi:hypothetical protein